MHHASVQRRGQTDGAVKVQSVRGPGATFSAHTLKIPFSNGTIPMRMLSSQLVAPFSGIFNLHSNVEPNATVRSSTSLTGIIDGREIEFKIPKNGKFINRIIAKMTLANADGSNTITVVPAPLLFDRVSSVSGGNVLFDKTGLSMYIDECLHTDKDKFDVVAGVNNINSSTYAFNATSGVIAASGSQTYYVDVTPYLSSGHLYFDTVADGLTLRFKFNSAASHKAAGSAASTDLSLSDMELHLFYDNMHPVDEANLKAQYAAGLAIRIPTESTYRETQTLANNQKYAFKLDSIQCLTPEVAVVVRASTTTTGQYTFGDVVSTLEFEDNAGRSLTEGRDYEVELLRTHIAAENYTNPDFIATSNLVMVPFIQGGAERLIKTGRNYGYQHLDRAQLQLTTNGSAGGSTYTIDVIAKRYSMLIFNKNGSVSIRHS